MFQSQQAQGVWNPDSELYLNINSIPIFSVNPCLCSAKAGLLFYGLYLNALLRGGNSVMNPGEKTVKGIIPTKWPCAKAK